MGERGPHIYIVMGVAGSGKTTIGKALASRLGCPFYDGDDFHPPENVARMAKGTPLTDLDRAPWLDALAELVRASLERGEEAVLACSALKKRYRDALRVDDRVTFIYLEGNFGLIRERLGGRGGHYMPPALLESQFDDLEPPETGEAVRVPIDLPVEAIVSRILAALGLKR